jgi:signal transduction histidine kinase
MASAAAGPGPGPGASQSAPAAPRGAGLRRAYRLLRERAPWAPPALLGQAFAATAVAMGLPAFLLVAVALGARGGFWLVLLLTAPLVALSIRPLTAVQRSRFAALLGLEIPVLPRIAGPYGPRRLHAWLRAETTRRQAGYHLLAAPVLAAAGAASLACSAVGLLFSTVYLWVWALPPQNRVADWGYTTQAAYLTALGLALLWLAPWIAEGVVRADVRLAAALLGPSLAEQLERRVEDLAESRAGVVDAADAERRRIERDLHDGVQQRLVSLAMNLGLARRTLKDLPPEALRVLAEAQQEAQAAIAELRDVVRGLHPAVLEDRGLDAALSGIAARAPLPVRLHVDMPERPVPTVEAVAYFVVAEALTNVVKHAGASRAEIWVAARNGLLRIAVSDDGRGGADPDAGPRAGSFAGGGSGLSGLRKRVASVDGRFSLSSPVGGPTTVTVELPCAL